jgi:hypothetical protein
VAAAGTNPAIDCEWDAVRPEALSPGTLEPKQQAVAASSPSTSGPSHDVLPSYESGVDLPGLPAASTICTEEAADRNRIQ